MSKRDVQNGAYKPLQKDAVVGLLVDQPQHVATLDLQHVDEVVVVTGDDVSTVMGEVPVLIGDGGYFDLEGKRENAEVYMWSIIRKKCACGRDGHHAIRLKNVPCKA